MNCWSAGAPTQGDATRRGDMELAGRGGGARGRIGGTEWGLPRRARCPRHDDMGRDVSGMDGAARRHQSLSISGDVFSGLWVGGCYRCAARSSAGTGRQTTALALQVVVSRSAADLQYGGRVCRRPCRRLLRARATLRYFSYGFSGCGVRIARFRVAD